MRKDMMDSAEGREAFMYEIYPVYAEAAGWPSFDTEEATEAERKMFAREQSRRLAPVSVVAIRHLLSLLNP